MYSNFFTTLNGQYQNAFAPYLKYNQLIAKSFADITNLQLESARQYAEIGLAQLAVNSQVCDLQTLTTSGMKQLETMTKLSQQLIEDGKKVAALASQFKADLDQIIAEAVPTKK